jgi:hypothetical protein
MNHMSNKLKIAQEVPLPIDGPSLDDEADEESPPDRSPQRIALAKEIQIYNSSLAEVKALSAGVDYARSEIREAQKALRLAEDRLTTAKADTAAHMVSRSLGASHPGHRTTAQARNQLQIAEDDLESMVEAEATLNGRLRECQTRADATRGRLTSLVQEVIKSDPATHAYIRRFGDLHREYMNAKAFLSERPTLHPEDPKKFELLGDTRVDLSVALAPWSWWEKRLLEDADAELVLPD